MAKEIHLRVKKDRGNKTTIRTDNIHFHVKKKLACSWTACGHGNSVEGNLATDQSLKYAYPALQSMVCEFTRDINGI